MCTLLKTIKLYGQSCPKVCVEEGVGATPPPARSLLALFFSVVTCAHCPSNSLQTDARLLPSVGDVCASRESPPTNRRRRKTQASRWHGPGAHRMFAPSQQAAFGGAPGPKNTKKETKQKTLKFHPLTHCCGPSAVKFTSDQYVGLRGLRVALRRVGARQHLFEERTVLHITLRFTSWFARASE